jgi:hypothetical protein
MAENIHDVGARATLSNNVMSHVVPETMGIDARDFRPIAVSPQHLADSFQ